MSTHKRLISGLSGIIILSLLLNIFIFCSAKLSGEYLETKNVWGQQDAVSKSDYQKKLNILADLPSDLSDAEELMNASYNYLDTLYYLENKKYATNAMWQTFEAQTAPYPVTRTGSGSKDRILFSDIAKNLERINSYPDYIRSIPENARIISDVMTSLPSDNSYLLSNVAKCQKDYYGLEYLQLTPTVDISLTLALQYNVTDIIAVLMLLITAVFFSRTIKKQGNEYVDKSRKLIITTFIFSAFGILMLYVSNLSAAGYVLGFPSLHTPIQSFDSFATCPAAFTLGTFLLFWLIIKLLTNLLFLILISLVLMKRPSAKPLSNRFPKNISPAGIITVIAVFAEAILFFFNPASSGQNPGLLFNLHEINLFAGFTPERFFNRYLNLNIFGNAVSRFGAYLTVFLLAAFPLTVFSLRRLLKVMNSTRENLRKSYYSEIEAKYKETRRLWHDFNNHLLTVKALYSAGKNEEAEKYIKELEALDKDYRLPTRTGSDALDLLLFHKNRAAIEQGMRIEFVTACRLETLHFTDYDLCGLVGNLLDNAMEACTEIQGGQPVISLSLEAKGTMLIVTCSNPFAGERHTSESGKAMSASAKAKSGSSGSAASNAEPGNSVFATSKEKSGSSGTSAKKTEPGNSASAAQNENDISFTTTKKDTENHGIGLSSVKQICKKYTGNINITVENSTFRVSCLLNAPGK